MRREMDDIPAGKNAAHQYLLNKDRSIHRFEDVEKSLPLLEVDGTSWKTEDRDFAMENWLKDPARHLPMGRGTLSLYKSCLRLRNCLPEQIIDTYRFNLQYDPYQHQPAGSRRSKEPTVNRVQPSGWGREFCQELRILVAHPMLGRSVTGLAPAIQYTVMVESGDVWRPWQGAELPRTSAFDSFVYELAKMSREQVGRSVTDIRKELSERGRDHDNDNPTPYDLLFQAIEEEVKTRGGARKCSADYWAPYFVREKHLKILCVALEKMSPIGFPAYHNADTFATALSVRVPVIEYPNKDEIHELREHGLHWSHERALKRTMQQWLQWSRANPK